jgi:iron-sulfur cluster repair protein YtfE (RIC family)
MDLPGLAQLEADIAVAQAASDPTAFLLADHAWLRALLDEYRPFARRGENLAEIHEGIQELKPRLDLHIRREEEVYFPAVEDFMRESGQGSTFDMYGEHDAIRIRLDELLISLDRQSGVADAYAAFSRALLVHFENEEELIFAEAPAHLSEATRHELIAKFVSMAA